MAHKGLRKLALGTDLYCELIRGNQTVEPQLGTESSTYRSMIVRYTWDDDDRGFIVPTPPLSFTDVDVDDDDSAQLSCCWIPFLFFGHVHRVIDIKCLALI